MKIKTTFLFVLIIIIVCSFFIFPNSSLPADEMVLKNYYCPKCGLHIEAVNQPSMGSCKERGGHHWRCLGQVGDKNYQCSKCGLVIKSKDTPYGGVPCKNGGGHNWKRLS